MYQADIVDTEGHSYCYIGMTAEKFRFCYSKHAQSLRNPRYSKETKFSKKNWELREARMEGTGPTFKIKKVSHTHLE